MGLHTFFFFRRSIFPIFSPLFLFYRSRFFWAVFYSVWTKQRQAIRVYIYVHLCTCRSSGDRLLSVRAVHMEMAFSFSTDAFIIVLRRFISHKEKPHTIHCDNGTNFIGVSGELRCSMMDLNNSSVQNTLQHGEIEWPV